MIMGCKMRPLGCTLGYRLKMSRTTRNEGPARGNTEERAELTFCWKEMLLQGIVRYSGFRFAMSFLRQPRSMRRGLQSLIQTVVRWRGNTLPIAEPYTGVPFELD